MGWGELIGSVQAQFHRQLKNAHMRTVKTDFRTDFIQTFFEFWNTMLEEYIQYKYIQCNPTYFSIIKTGRLVFMTDKGVGFDF